MTANELVLIKMALQKARDIQEIVNLLSEPTRRALIQHDPQAKVFADMSIVTLGDALEKQAEKYNPLISVGELAQIISAGAKYVASQPTE